jgi:hypothetical protein
MPPPKPQVSPPFAARELNGERLLEELGELAESGVTQSRLDACALALRALSSLGPADAAAQVRGIAADDCGDSPGLSRMLLGWAARIRAEGDVPLLVGHFERLALVAALSAAARKATRSLAGREGGS